MSFLELLIIAIGLSMDAFAVSIGKGLSLKKIKLSHALKVGLWFGGFQALMPLIGYLLGSTFAEIVSTYDHWVAFVLLAIIGGNMLKESFEKDFFKGGYVISDTKPVWNTEVGTYTIELPNYIFKSTTIPASSKTGTA